MLTSITVADVFRPGAKSLARVYDAALIAGGAMLIGLSAQVKVFLPFSPVPITGQTFAVLMLGALLGARRGALCALLCIIAGIAGLPVFAAGTGLVALAGPTGGYLVGFVFAAYLTGYLAEKGWDRRVGTTILAMVLGNIVIHTFGVLWLSFLMGLRQAIMVGSCPFIIGDVLKIILAAMILPAGWRLLERMGLSK
jgi:biotin transport system substrate-specific component